jgi:ArsR family transcriptional regulator, arsenate/arsenite/antimonite-responsive transcriptional repressor
MSIAAYARMCNFEYPMLYVMRKLKTEKIDLHSLADTLKSVAHPERLWILQLIYIHQDEPLMVKDIYQSLGIDQSTTSRHLSIMKRSGLLTRKVKDGNTYYDVNPASLTALCLRQMLNMNKP